MIYSIPTYIFKNVHSPTLRPKGAQKLSNLRSAPKCWHNISNTNLYFQLTYIPQPCARRAHWNTPTHIHPPSFGMIYLIPTYNFSTWRMNVSFRVSVRPSGAGMGNIHFWIYMLVLNISCQHLGEECELESFCAPFGRRIGLGWADRIIACFGARTSARKTSARPHNYMFLRPDKCQGDKCQTS